MRNNKPHSFIVLKVTRVQLLNMFLQASSGAHVELPYVEVIQCNEFVVKPLHLTGSISVDGELIAMHEAHVKLVPKAAKVYSAGVET